jgi:hypothetical protein
MTAVSLNRPQTLPEVEFNCPIAPRDLAALSHLDLSLVVSPGLSAVVLSDEGGSLDFGDLEPPFHRVQYGYF